MVLGSSPGASQAGPLPAKLPLEQPATVTESSDNGGTKPNFTLLDIQCDQEIVPTDKDASPTGSSNDSGSDASDADRASWGGKMEFLLTCVGYAVGLGNVWRFPYLCYRNGGGAFLIPYVIMLVIVGLPMFFMEVAFGQFASLGPISIWKINPLMKGLGYGMVMVTWMITLYYNVIVAHTLFYTFASMSSPLPWVSCGNPWNTARCFSGNSTQEGLQNTSGAPFNESAGIAASMAGKTKTPAEEYYEEYVLQQTTGISDAGPLSWQLVLCLLLGWIIVYFCLIRGIKSLGKVVYFTAIFPYVMLTILLIRGATLPGASRGIEFYLKPDFSRLRDSRVWSDAATQIFYSLSTCSGGLIAMSSFNKFNNNCYRDSLLICAINCCTSIYAGFVIFTVLGFMAHEKGLGVQDVVDQGPGLAFVVYPEALARMPVAPLWAVFFFIMMATLGFGTQFSMVETVLTALSDELKPYINGTKKSIIFRSAIIFVSFLLGLPMVCGGGIYLLNLVDYSLGGFPLLFVGMIEMVTINWLYGHENFAKDIELMLGHRPNVYWKVCWVALTPLGIAVIILFSLVQYKPPTLDLYVYPAWAQALGWLVAVAPVAVIPAWAIAYFCRNGGLELLGDLIQHEPSWGPAATENRTGHYGARSQVPECPKKDGHILNNDSVMSAGPPPSAPPMSAANTYTNGYGSTATAPYHDTNV